MSNTHHSPPQRVGVGTKLLGVAILLGEVDEERGEDEAQEADVECREQLLPTDEDAIECCDMYADVIAVEHGVLQPCMRT